MSSEFKFTQKSLAEFMESAAGTRQTIRDTLCRGLVADLRAGGSLTFYMYKRIGGRPARIRIGPYPGITIEQARSAVVGFQGDVARGQDPRESRRRLREEPTIKDLFDHWMLYAEQHKQPKPVKEDRRYYKSFLAPWSGRRLSSVRKVDVQGLHGRVGKEHGHYTANRLLSLLSAMYGKASDIGYSGDNPVKGVTRFKEQQRDRFMQADEIPRFFASLASEPQDLQDFFTLALFTGARKSNVQAMRWDEVNLGSATWRIPRTKTNEPLTVPLTVEALEILGRRSQFVTSEWVFPSTRKSRSGHLQEPRHAWERIVERCGLRDLRIHDLRRTLGSWQAAGGSSLAIIGKSLGHKHESTTTIYARLNLDPVRESVDAAVTSMVAARKAGSIEMPID